MKISLLENKKTILSDLTERDISFMSGNQFESQLKLKRTLSGNSYELTPENIVGAFSLPSGIKLSILPKIGLPNLFKMMSFVEGSYNPFSSDFEYEKDQNIFDILAAEFASELEKILRYGLKQGFVSQEGALRTLRGQIRFADSIKNGLLGAGKLACRFQTLTIDSPINRAFVTAARIVLRSDLVSRAVKVSVRKCLDQIPIGLVAKTMTVDDLKSISIDRTTSSFERILFLSTIIIRSTSYSNSFGESKFPGFLLNMADLFEKYATKSLKSYLGISGVRILSQQHEHLDYDKQVHVRPDIIIEVHGVKKFVADTKYKDFSDLKFRNEDVYQMLSYLLRYKCTEGFLIYPTFSPDCSGLVKTIRIPADFGEFLVHGVCVRLDDPAEVGGVLRRLFSNMNVNDVGQAV